jgi:hypothetical protein
VTESACRVAVAGRSDGVCEVTGARAAEMSHRVARSRGGLWRPANLLHLSSAAHRWCHANPVLARSAGWHLPAGVDVTGAAVWLARPWPGWWLIDDTPRDGGGHVVVPYEGDLPEPVAALASIAGVNA